MNLRTVASSLLLTFALACASSDSGTTSDGPGTANRPPMQVTQTGPIFFGSSSDAPVGLEFTILNDTTEPFTIWRITVQDSGMLQYSVPPITRDFRKVIAPGTQETFSIVATASTSTYRLNPSEPLLVRVTLEGERGGKRFRSVYLRERVQ